MKTVKNDLERQLSHDRLASRFDELMDAYDVGRRIEILVGQFLEEVDLKGSLALDGGCGVGGLTTALQARGATVVAVDIGQQLLRETRSRLGCRAACGSLMSLPFPDDTFDVVLSSEVIEHTPSPADAVAELYRVVRPGGHLVVSTPNRLWEFPVRLASTLRLRPYDGFENFLWPSALRRTIERRGGRIVAHRGVHLWPWQLRALRGVSRRVDAWGDRLLPLMINQCLHAVKPSSGDIS